MINLTNKFIAVGQLQEANIQLYPTHIKIKLSLKTNDTILALYQTISKQFDKLQYDNIISMLPNLHCKIDGWVYVNGERYYKLKQDKPSRLFVSGNLSAYSNRVFFNMCYMQFSNAADLLTIDLDGQWINNHQFLNVLYSSPRIFNIKPPNIWQDDCLYHLKLGYNAGYNIIDSIAQSNDNSELSILSYDKLDKYIDDELKKKLLLEWEIISE